MGESEVRTELWPRVRQRLNRGDVLIRNEDFPNAFEVEFSKLSGEDFPAQLRASLRSQVDELHRRHPETYLAQGVENAVRRAFDECVQQLQWNAASVEQHGWHVIRRVLNSERVRSFVDQMHLGDIPINVANCIRDTLDSLEDPPAPTKVGSTLVATAEEIEREAVSGSTSAGGPRVNTPAAELDTVLKSAAIEAGIDASVAAQRVREQEEVHADLMQKEMERVPETVSVCVADSLLSETEADQFRSLVFIDNRHRSGEIDSAEAERQQNEILTVDGRRQLDAAVRKAVGGTVTYIQLFESLKKIRDTYDEALKLLVKNKDAVIGKDGDRTPLLAQLSDNTSLLDLLVSMAERQDPEIRLLAARLPPYGHLGREKLKPIANLTVDGEFVDDLRRKSTEDLSALLCADDSAKRAKPAADIHSLIHIIDHVVEPTPFRLKLRLLQANRILHDTRPRLEEIFRSDDAAEARRKAERVLRQRLDRPFADASSEEQTAARKRGEALVLAIEQQLETSRDDRAPSLEQALKEQREEDEQVDGDEDALTPEEVARGVLLARVEVRVAGRLKKLPTKIMPDPDDAEKQVMAQRDPGTG